MSQILTTETIYKNENSSSAPFKKLDIIHFNDVYNIEENDKEPKGGAARFVNLIEHLLKSSSNPTLVLFSGDAISPSNGRLTF